DKFEEIVRQAVEEHFDLLSVTFQSEDVNSKATEQYGWRVTPYAYLLLKSRGPEVDKIPPVRLDLDFLDTSGYAVIPVESPAVPIDSSPLSGDQRPLQNVKITQTLDERQADDGKLILEIKATAQGLVPKLGDILDLGPEGFDLVEPEDQSVSVSRFDPDSEETVVVTERSWMVTMHARQDLPERPTMFQFGEPKLAAEENVYQRYDDADLMTVDREISLLEQYGETSYAWIWPAFGLLGVGIALVMLVVLSSRRTRQTVAPRFELPESITPFTALGLLRQIEQNNGFDVNGTWTLRVDNSAGSSTGVIDSWNIFFNLGEVDCTDSIDNDLDGDTDCADAECVGHASCQGGPSGEDCTSGSGDEDGDGFFNCDDTDCSSDPACPEDCTNGTDDD
ncbi:MAG: hypothetical protein QGF59_30470, partial [Pirellulaceae bacterium]|nr:hypothetical protein [Pirellulaceae bacterium]